MLQWSALILLASLVSPPCARTADAASWPDDPFATPLIREIQGQHDLAAGGDKNATRQLHDKLEKLCAEHPRDALLKAYLGSVLTLMSRDAFPGPSKLRFLKDGLRTMDDAVAMDDQRSAPRFIRAVNNYSLPAFINRRDNARKDFQILLLQLDQPTCPFGPETRQAVYYFAGLVFKDLDRPQDAHTSWTKALQVTTSTPLTEKIQHEMARL